MSETAGSLPSNRWANAWPDGLAFLGGLGVAWVFHWEVRDLVWSLWLSSLVVGYAMIVWSIFRPAVAFGVNVSRDPGFKLAQAPVGTMALGAGAYLIGGLFLLAFFTFHFGMFHFVHSVFLNSFFPVESGWARAIPGPALYWEVLHRYWWFLPAAAIAERAAFRVLPTKPEPPDISVKAADIAARKARKTRTGLGGGDMMAPYKNVIRLHLLIFFFAGAHFMKLDSFVVYAVVYAVYFFPWRVVKRETV